MKRRVRPLYALAAVAFATAGTAALAVAALPVAVSFAAWLCVEALLPSVVVPVEEREERR